MQGYAQSFDPASASQTFQLTMRGGAALVLSESMDRGLQTAPHVVLKVARTNTDNYQAASEIASQTDLVVTLPRQLARRHAQDITQLPFDWRP